ncbi:hypothetical protein [Ruegeria sediminis]|uniref:hypothetical protein n=1 Tax=Ruegeria sediminis TaxID=2583820 RepID=UPI0014863E9E|nr:hypothetical protein [Ruegeria sediminis]
MHFDLFHAAVAAVLILATIWGMRRAGLVDGEHRGWDWKIFAAIFVVMFVFNLIWPFGQ